MSEIKERTYRYERKFVVEQMEPAQVRALIKGHPALFIEPYPPRHINNIYLDTPEMDYYFENINGVKDRRKARIRWYGNLFDRVQKPTLEFKIKNGLVGTKASYRFPDFEFDTKFTRSHYDALLRNELISPELNFLLRAHTPVLVNRYYRCYYATVDRRYRITVDTEMSYYNIRSLNNPFHYAVRNHLSFVMELKYDQEYDPEANRIAHFFPFSLTKNSKYIEGIESVFH